MLLLSQIREELATYFELLQQPKTATEKVVRDRVVGLHNELVKIETLAAVVPVEDLHKALASVEIESFKATVKSVEELIEARKPKAQPTVSEAPAQAQG